jgi:hypothetical protein
MDVILFVCCLIGAFVEGTRFDNKPRKFPFALLFGVSVLGVRYFG